jgi:coenzyme F420-reducing hydrogenase delta subunit
MRFMQELLGFVGVEGRLHLEWISSAEAQKFADTITNFTEKIQAMGPSQMNTMLTSSQAELLLGNIDKDPVAAEV